VSSTDVLLNVATAARLFHTSDGTGFADLSMDNHRETGPLRSKRFQAWLRQQYYERTWDAPSPAALNAALNVLEAQAQFDSPQRKVSVRLAEQDGAIYLDLRMSSGVASKSAPADGESPRTLRSDSAAQPACGHFLSEKVENHDQKKKTPLVTSFPDITGDGTAGARANARCTRRAVGGSPRGRGIFVGMLAGGNGSDHHVGRFRKISILIL
jgi:hypothetical protein